MGRHKKETVDFFPHYTAAEPALFILDQKYGNDGYKFYFTLKEQLGNHEGHYFYCRNPHNWEFLLAITRISAEKCEEMLDLLASLGEINKALWHDSGVVWSQNFVNNVSIVYKNRKQPLPKIPFRRVETPVSIVETTSNHQSDGVSTGSNPEKCDSTRISTHENAQSRGEYINPPISPPNDELGKPDKPTGRRSGKRVKVEVDYDAEIPKALDRFPLHLQAKVTAWIQVVSSVNGSGTISQSRYLNLLGELGYALQATNQADFEAALAYATEKKKTSVAYITATIQNKILDREKNGTKPSGAGASKPVDASAPSYWIYAPFDDTWTRRLPDGTTETLPDKVFQERKNKGAMSPVGGLVGAIVDSMTTQPTKKGAEA
jgi:hypothetical protein